MVLVLCLILSSSISALPMVNAPTTPPLVCQGVSSLCADFTVSAISPLTTMFSTQVVNSASPSISWNFGDGTTGSGNPAVHTFSQGEYLVTLTVNDGAASYTVRHDVSEIANLPSKPFVTPSSASLNTFVPCRASITTIPGIIGN